MNQPGTVDLPQPEQVSPLMDEAPRALGTIDILVHNAGTLWAAPAEDHPGSSGREVMGLNIDAFIFLAAFLCSDASRHVTHKVRWVVGTKARFHAARPMGLQIPQKLSSLEPIFALDAPSSTAS